MSNKATTEPSDEVYQRLSTADSVHITGGHPTVSFHSSWSLPIRDISFQSSVRVLNDIVKCMRFMTHVVREQKQAEFNQSTWTTAAFRLDCVAFVIFLTTNILTTVILLADPWITISILRLLYKRHIILNGEGGSWLKLDYHAIVVFLLRVVNKSSIWSRAPRSSNKKRRNHENNQNVINKI